MWPLNGRLGRSTLAGLMIAGAGTQLAWPGATYALPKGSFFNPLNVAWHEILPIKIAGIKIKSGRNYDTPDSANSPICVCPAPPPLFFRLGISLSLWEPARLVETVKDPFYSPFFGVGFGGSGTGKLAGANHSAVEAGSDNTFAQAHWMIFPVWTMLELFVDFICVDQLKFDIAYLTEIDPLWQDDSLSAIINPEALLFANPVAQLACIADSVAVNVWRPLEALFWCMGSSGSAYPLTGRVEDENVIQANFGIASRMVFKLGRELLLWDTGLSLCSEVPTPIWYKPNYKFQPAKPRNKKKAYPIGKGSLIFGAALNPTYGNGSGSADNFMWIVFRKRVCCLL